MRKRKNGLIVFIIIFVIIIALVIDFLVLTSPNLPSWFKLWFIFK